MPNRRHFLKAMVGGLGLALAGCTGEELTAGLGEQGHDPIQHLQAEVAVLVRSIIDMEALYAQLVGRGEEFSHPYSFALHQFAVYLVHHEGFDPFAPDFWPRVQARMEADLGLEGEGVPEGGGDTLPDIFPTPKKEE